MAARVRGRTAGPRATRTGDDAAGAPAPAQRARRPAPAAGQHRHRQRRAVRGVHRRPAGAAAAAGRGHRPGAQGRRARVVSGSQRRVRRRCSTRSAARCPTGPDPGSAAARRGWSAARSPCLSALAVLGRRRQTCCMIVVGWSLVQAVANLYQAALTAVVPDRVPPAAAGSASAVVGVAMSVGAVAGVGPRRTFRQPPGLGLPRARGACSR